MELAEVEFNGKLLRNGKFIYTLHPGSVSPNSLCYATGGKYLKEAIENPAVTCIITTKDKADSIPVSKGLLITTDPQALYYKIHDYLVLSKKVQLLSETFISPSATIHSSVEIRGNVLIENDVIIERDAIIEPNTIIRNGSYLGNRVVIGTKGMQKLSVNNQFIRVAYAGGVMIGENVEVLDMAVVQRPYNYMYTKIGNGTKISLMANIGHGSNIGNNTMIAGNTQISGNVNIGNNVWIGPSVTIADGINIEDNAKILIGSVVVSNIKSSSAVSGNFALDHKKQLKNSSKIKKL